MTVIIQTSEKIGLCGNPGQGKTAKAKHLIFERYNMPGIIVDLEGEFFKTNIYKNINYKKFESIDSLINYLKKNNAKWRYGNEKLILTDVGNNINDPISEKKELEKLWVFIFEFKRNCVERKIHFQTLIYLDEADSYCEKHSNSTLNFLIRKARNLDIDILIAFQRIQGIHNDILSKLDKMYCFQMQLPEDLDKIRKNCSEETACLLKDLQKFHYICYEKGKGPRAEYISNELLNYI